LVKKIGGGVVAYEALRVATDTVKGAEQYALAGNDARGQNKAAQGVVQSIESIPLAGQAFGLLDHMVGNPLKSEATLAAADAQDAAGDQMVASHEFQVGQGVQHAVAQAKTPYEAQRAQIAGNLQEREFSIARDAREQTATINAAANKEAVEHVTSQTNPVWIATHTQEYDKLINDWQRYYVGGQTNAVSTEEGVLKANAAQDADRQNVILGQAEANEIASERVAVKTSQATGQAAAETANRDPLAAFQTERAAERRQELQETQNQIASAAIDDPKKWEQLRAYRTATFGTADPETGQYVGGSFDATTDAGVVEQRRQSAMRVEDLSAQGTAAEESIGGQRDRASATLRTRALVREAEQLPMADATSPEARAERAAGLSTITQQLQAQRSELTGGHGGAVVKGETFGEAGAEILATRYRRGEETAERGDITAAIDRVNSGAATPMIGGVPAGGRSPPGGPLPPTPAQVTQGEKAKAYHDLQAASAALRNTHAGDPNRRDRQNAVNAARQRYDAAIKANRDVHAPHNGHAKMGGIIAAAQLTDAVKGPDGLYHVSSHGGVEGTVDQEAHDRLTEDYLAQLKHAGIAPTEKRARNEAHGATVAVPADEKHAKLKYGITAAAELSDATQNAGGTVSFKSRSAGIEAELSPDMAANLERATSARVRALTPKQLAQAASDEAHGKITTPDRANTAPPTAQMRAARAAAEAREGHPTIAPYPRPVVSQMRAAVPAPPNPIARSGGGQGGSADSALATIARNTAATVAALKTQAKAPASPALPIGSAGY
jgi:hypothetical protein